MYRPNPGSISTSQIGSLWSQQYEFELNKQLENNILHQYDPRVASIQDFDKWLSEYNTSNNKKFISMADMNQ